MLTKIKVLRVLLAHGFWVVAGLVTAAGAGVGVGVGLGVGADCLV